MNKEECATACNKLLRGELSAIETYGQAIEKFGDSPVGETLREFRRHHVESANTLRDHLHQMGADADTESGIWGTWATAVEGIAKALGEKAAVAVLIEGEAHGASEYEKALENPDVMEDIKAAIRTRLLPRQNRHMDALNAAR